MDYHKILILKNRIFLIVFVILLTAISMLSGCGNEIVQNQSIEKTITCVDSVGRKVEVPAHVETIAALDSFAAQAVFVLGEGDKIIAAVGGVQRDKLLQEISPKLAQASIPMNSATINAEELLRLDPDITFVKGSVYATESEKAKLDALGIPFLVVQYTDMKSQMDAMDLIGMALGKQKTAEAYRRYYEDTIDLVKKRTKDIPDNELPTIYHSVSEAVRTDGSGSLGADWISVTRAINVSVNEQLKYRDNNYYATLEQIYRWNPEIIICNESLVPEYILTDEKWSGLDAVEDKTVYQMPIGASRWGHQGSAETPLGILWLAKLLYPEQFWDIDLYEETKSFYQTFYHYDVTPEIMDSILTGKGIREPGNKSSGNGM